MLTWSSQEDLCSSADIGLHSILGSVLVTRAFSWSINVGCALRHHFRLADQAISGINSQSRCNHLEMKARIDRRFNGAEPARQGTYSLSCRMLNRFGASAARGPHSDPCATRIMSRSFANCSHLQPRLSGNPCSRLLWPTHAQIFFMWISHITSISKPEPQRRQQASFQTPG